MVCLEINYLEYILQYTIYIFYKILEFLEYPKRFQNTKILLVWSLYYTKQQNYEHQSVGFYKSHKIS